MLARASSRQELRIDIYIYTHNDYIKNVIYIFIYFFIYSAYNMYIYIYENINDLAIHVYIYITHTYIGIYTAGIFRMYMFAYVRLGQLVKVQGCVGLRQA